MSQTFESLASHIRWAESIGASGVGDNRIIEIDIHLPGFNEPQPVVLPIASARTLHDMLGDALDGDTEDADEDEPPAAPDGDLSAGAAFLVNAIENARMSELQAAFRHLGWPIRFEIATKGGGSVDFPEDIAPFSLHAPAEPDGRWGLADGGLWFPVMFADRDACLVAMGLITAGGWMTGFEELQNEINCGPEHRGVTVADLLERFGGQVDAEGDEE